MANALRGVPVILGKGSEETAFRVGQHMGIAFQVIDDIMDYVSTTEEMGKEAMADIASNNVTAPVLLALNHCYKEGSVQKDVAKALGTRSKRK